MRKKETVLKKYDNRGNVLPKGISQRKDGRYIYRCTHNGIVYSPVYSYDLEELKRYALRMQVKLEDEDFKEPSRMTLNQYFDYYMDTCRKGEIKAVSYQNMRNYWRLHIEKSQGKRPIQKVKRVDLMKLYTEKQKGSRALAWSTIQRINNMVYNVMEQARVDGLISINPAERVLDITPKLSEAQERDALTEEQVETFLTYISGHRFFKNHKRLFTVLFGTGMRVGECCALCGRDLNFEDGYISIYKTLYYKDITGEGHRRKWIGGTKSQAGTRTLPMIDGVRHALEEQKAWMKEVKHKNCERVEVNHEVGEVVGLKDHYSDFVFLTDNGTAYTPDYVTQIIKKIVRSYNKVETRNAKAEKREAELLPEFSAHYTRHTFATRAAELGVDEENIARWLGHADAVVADGKKTKTRRVTRGYIHEKWEDGWKKLVGDIPTLNKMKVS